MIPQSTSPSSIPDVKLGFSRWDVQVAKATVRALIRAGIRKGPSTLLVMEPWMYDAWLEEDAVAFLEEQRARQRP